MTKNLLAIVATAGVAMALNSAAMAQTPGIQMQEKGSVSGSPGASGYTPGDQMQEKGSVKGTTGASGYAPGRSTTGTSANGDVNVKAGGAKARAGAGAKVK